MSYDRLLHPVTRNLMFSAVLMTTFLFWNVLEVTVGLLAACIPVPCTLVNTSSIDSVSQSVRSEFSLNSLHSSSRPTEGRDEDITLQNCGGHKILPDDLSNTSRQNTLGFSSNNETIAPIAIGINTNEVTKGSVKGIRVD
ncbi:hypothetical protein K504DRAFT_496454 [Pleomassaria siparia CBS 279.74]|uniref:Uncharacterized protein n=1 Tax=Pleomassaria siparia CBS 279.74 TaxID=1314801 RepID=A0A6G1KNW3_9PLEO|nr:hypothetical protein K504DRAFT_496454 [Pleomassaria siparia CBS 279.74]